MPRKAAPFRWGGDWEKAIAHICERLSLGGVPLSVIRSEMEPKITKDQLRGRRDSHPEWNAAIEDAFETGMDVLARECLDIADDTEELVFDGTTTAASREKYRKSIKAKRLRIHTRMQLLKTWDHSRYGDKRTLAGDPNNPLFPELTDEQAEARVQELLAKAKHPDRNDHGQQEESPSQVQVRVQPKEGKQKGRGPARGKRGS